MSNSVSDEKAVMYITEDVKIVGLDSSVEIIKIASKKATKP
ncbi:MAG: hypothetical protein RLZZ532_778, partial [Cyanobacteriota bacterium]